MARPRSLAILVPLIWLGFALRLHDLAAVPLRGDEAFSALNWAGMALQQSLAQIATIEPHPPLVYALFRFWGRFIGGIDSPFALRMLPVLGNLIGLSAAFALAFRLTGRRNAGYAAALLWAIHPYEIWHSQDFRNYAIWAGLSVTSLWLALRLLDGPPRGYRQWLLYTGWAVASALIFYSEIFVSVALAVYALCWKRKDRRIALRFLSVQGIVALTALSAFTILQADLIGSGAYPGNLGSLYAPDFWLRFLPILSLGESAPGLSSWLWLPLALAYGGYAVLVARGCRRELLFIAALVILPFTLLGVASLRVNIFHARYVLASVPALILLIASGSERLAGGLAKATGARPGFVMVMLLTPWIALSALSLHNYFDDPAFRKAPAWHELGDFLNRWASSDDLVIQLSADAAFGYYYRGAAEARALPSGPEQSASSIIAELAALTKSRPNYDSIFVVSNAIASWSNAHVVEDWMRENMQPVLLSDASGLGIRQYMRWNIEHTGAPALANFAGIVDLLDYRFYDEALPTGELLLHVYWKPQTETGKPLKSFAHVYGDINAHTGSGLWTQADQFPQSGRIDSRSWTPGSIFRDVYYLPADSLPAGEYELRLGWYEPESGDRLLTNKESDNFLLQSFGLPPQP